MDLYNANILLLYSKNGLKWISFKHDLFPKIVGASGKSKKTLLKQIKDDLENSTRLRNLKINYSRVGPKTAGDQARRYANNRGVCGLLFYRTGLEGQTSTGHHASLFFLTPSPRVLNIFDPQTTSGQAHLSYKKLYEGAQLSGPFHQYFGNQPYSFDCLYRALHGLGLILGGVNLKDHFSYRLNNFESLHWQSLEYFVYSFSFITLTILIWNYH